MPRLTLGPLLRYVDETSATVWVETDSPAAVAVEATPPGGPPFAATAPTWEVAGHHYALVVLRDLAPGTDTPYRVTLDGEEVWPLPGSPYPGSRIRTLPDVAEGRAIRLAFGSCRWAAPPSLREAGLDPDALDTLAVQLINSGHPDREWPDVLLLLGDQVYADETTPATRAWLARRRDLKRAPHGQVADFEEYTHLYYESWLDPEIRWLLSNVPSCMIFDDHDVIDDWNTSRSWRRDMAATAWWEDRVVGGLASYWVYQHLGNLAPTALEADPLYAAVTTSSGDAAKLLFEHARQADAVADLDDDGPGRDEAADRFRWSYRRDLGRVRLLMVDNRAGRVLTQGRRSLVCARDMRWIAEQVTDGDYDHLLIGSSLPWLLPQAVHDAEAWTEALCDGARGPRWAAAAERLRRAADLEHWAAFRYSFEALGTLLADRVRKAAPRATVCVLSGDVHHAYLMTARCPAPDGTSADIVQLTCSPVHGSVPAANRLGFRFAWSPVARAIGRLLTRHARLGPSPIARLSQEGPFFGNQLMTLTLRGRGAHLLLERTRTPGSGGDAFLEPVTTAELGGRPS